MATIYLIRHGQASFGLENYDDLSPLGIQQAKFLGGIFKQNQLTADRVFSGSMMRQQQTASHCLTEMGSSISIQTESAWNEFDHRDIIAKYNERYADMNNVRLDVMQAANPKEKIKELLTGAVTRWTSGEHDDYNESWWAFCKRIENGLKSIHENSEKKETIFVFTSGGSISAVMKQLLELPVQKTFELQLYTANASVTKIKTTSSGWQLISFNDHSHFGGEHKKLLTFR